MISLTITRASLALADLVITEIETGGFWLPEDGIEEPDTTWRYTYAPDSSDIHGKQLLQAVKEHSALPLSIYARGATAGALADRKAELAAALEQFSYSAQLLVNSQGFTWSCDPTSPRWGALDSGMARVHMARASVVIPVYPIGA